MPKARDVDTFLVKNVFNSLFHHYHKVQKFLFKICYYQNNISPINSKAIRV